MREAVERNDPDALAELADSQEMINQAAYTLRRLGGLLCGTAGKRDLGIRVLRQAQQIYPSDFWINDSLGFQLNKATPDQRDDCVRFYSIAVALQLDNAGARLKLGVALDDQGKPGEAITEYRKLSS